MITKEQFKACMIHAKQAHLDKFYNPLVMTMAQFKINTPVRMAAFLAQVAHESGCLKFVKELASGEDYDTGKKAKSLGNTPEPDGDGQRYKGRGLIQLTGLSNYRALSEEIGVDFVKYPERLEEPFNAAYCAGWFWHKAKLNEIADENTIEAFELITRRINGGINGLPDRILHWERAKRVLYTHA